MADLLDRAKALLLIKDALPDVFAPQKAALIEQVFPLGLVDATRTFSELVTIGFISTDELREYAMKLLAPPAPVVAPQPVVEVKQQPPKLLPKLDSVLKNFLNEIAEQSGISLSALEPLSSTCATLEAHTIQELLELEKKDNQFNCLSELMAESERDIFAKLMVFLHKEVPEIAEKEKKEQVERENQKQTQKKLDDEKNYLENSMLQIWGDQASALFFPGLGKFHFFSVVDQEIKEEANNLQNTEHLLFFLDISSSMNHDQEGNYLAPGSRDHAASSIKKARALIAPVAMAALKRNSGVTLVPWNSRIKQPIVFQPEEFIDKDTGELFEDQILLNELNKRTSENVFTASSATNVEAALRHLQTYAFKLAKERCTSLTMWFLTDGEETRYVGPAGESCTIPTNPTAPDYTFFHSVVNGSTGYQSTLIRLLENLMKGLSEFKTTLDCHWCHFGEADPLFLRKLREATNGHFHAVADIAKLQAEMLAAAHAPASKITLIANEKEHPVDSSDSFGTLFGRGELNAGDYLGIFKKKHVLIKTPAGVLDLPFSSSETLDPNILKVVETVLSLEPQLSKLMSELNKDISPDNIHRISKQLKKLKNDRFEIISGIGKSVPSGSLMQAFLEKTLETVESQIAALTRMLEQYVLPEGQNYDANAVKTSEFFTKREQLAISAGLESMKVRVGAGFIPQACLDKRIRQIVVSKGSWARKLLKRKCIVAETEHDDETTTITLLILDESQIQEAKQNVMRTVFNKQSPASCEYSEILFHDSQSNALSATVIVKEDGVTEKKVLPIGDVYPNPAGEYTVRVNTDDLFEAKKRILDPLSYASFLELIQDSSTLPAYLYIVAGDQSAGLLYGAKEMLNVISGGSDVTSFAYFRLFWRLADKDKNDAVQVPGTFHPANWALPIAPEPLSNLVLSTVMPGLMSEFITGTPMAPLTEMGLIYIGYIMMHLRQKAAVELDFLRIAEFLCTVACWIDNPKTLPKKEDVLESTQRMCESRSITTADSPGQVIPVKAVAYLLLGSSAPLKDRFTPLHNEAFSRITKLLLGKVNGTTPGKLSQRLIDNQLFLREWVHQVITDLVPLFPLHNKFNKPEDLDEEIPIRFISATHTIKLCVEAGNDHSILKQYLSDQVISVLGRHLHQLLHKVGGAAFGISNQWATFQRILAHWTVVGSYPFEELKKTFAAFREPTAYLKHCAVESAEIGKINFGDILCSWVESQGDKNFFCSFNYKDGLLTVHNNTLGTSTVATPEQTFEHLWPFYTQLFGRFTQFKGREYAAHGLLEIDWAVVKALKNPDLVKDLQGTQVSDHQAARNFKNKAYDKWVVKVELPQLGSHTKATQSARKISDKRRLSIVFLGEVDHGKSTTAGHVIAQSGFVDPHIMKKFEQEARTVGKENYKFAWVMDRLKEERERGVSIEVSFWSIMTENFEVDILDAPGHRKFFKNMATGASLADCAILVVSAAPLEFEKSIAEGSMLLEEAFTAFAVGIRQFIVCVNKMDAVKYDQKRFENVVWETRAFLKKIGVQQDKISHVPISAFEGEGLMRASDKMPWFEGFSITHRDKSVKTGKSLIEAIDCVEPPERDPKTPLRVPILKKHKIPGYGTVVVGRVASGVISQGQNLLILPDNLDAQCNSIEIHHVSRTQGGPGDVIGFNIKRAGAASVKRGMVAVDPAKPFKPVRRFVVRLMISNWKHPIQVGWECFCFCHTASFTIHFEKLIAKIDRKTGKETEKDPASITDGEGAIVEVSTVHKVCVEPFATCPPLGRICCVQGGNLVALGVVLSVIDEPAQTGPKVVGNKPQGGAKPPQKVGAKKK